MHHKQGMLSEFSIETRFECMSQARRQVAGILNRFDDRGRSSVCVFSGFEALILMGTMAFALSERWLDDPLILFFSGFVVA